MRILIINLLATALLLFGATGASAFALNATLNPGSDATGAMAPSDFLIVDVYLDADAAGLNGFAVAVLWDDNGTLAYEPGLSDMKTYILYTGGKGATYLIPNVDPPGYWNGTQQPGKAQVNIEFIEAGLGTAAATGNNIWIASLVFHVAANGGPTVLDLTFAAAGTVMQVNNTDVQGSTTTSGSFTIIPEPTTALLIGFGLAGLALAGRRQD